MDSAARDPKERNFVASLLVPKGSLWDNDYFNNLLVTILKSCLVLFESTFPRRGPFGRRGTRYHAGLAPLDCIL